MVDGKRFEVDFRLLSQNSVSLILNGRSNVFYIERNESGYKLDWQGGRIHLEVEDARSLLQKQLLSGKSSAKDKITVKAPMPGLIVKVLTTVGAQIFKGAPLIVVEAMKMENELASPLTGKVLEIKVSEKQAVEKNEALIVIASD
jgi:biotin carboxyl carrier protein